MSEHGLSRAVCDFISRHIDSVSTLEILLLFKKNPQREWSADTLSKELRTNSNWTQRQLSSLLAKGFIVHADNPHYFHYNSADAEMDKVVSEVLEAYTKMRFAVISLISDHLLRIREFADAFVIRKDKKDG